MPRILTLPPELTIYTLAQLRPQWLECVESAQQWQVDGAEVKEIDAAGIQLVLSLARSLAAVQGSLSLVNPSGVLTAACEGLGVATLLPCRADLGGAP